MAGVELATARTDNSKNRSRSFASLQDDKKKKQEQQQILRFAKDDNQK
jgi:hypothetical protein